jgi:hypothetical protein
VGEHFNERWNGRRSEDADRLCGAKPLGSIRRWKFVRPSLKSSTGDGWRGFCAASAGEG